MIVIFSLLTIFPILILAQVKTVPLSGISQSKIGETFTVQGRIANIIPPKSATAPYSIYLTDDTDTLLIVAWEKVMSRIPFRDQLKPDARVKVTGTLREYRGNLNFYLTEPGNIVLLGDDLEPVNIGNSSESSVSFQDLPPGVSLPGEIERSQMGRKVTIQGMVREYRAARSETAPHSIFLEGGSGSLRVVYWGEVASSLGSQNTPKPGQNLRIRGTVDEFRGELQLKVTNARDIQPVKNEGATSYPAPSDFIPLDSIGESHKGKEITVTGKIIDMNPSQDAAGDNKATLMDGAGALIILYDNHVAERLKGDLKLEMGKAYEIKGVILEESGMLRLKVSDASKIKVVSVKKDGAASKETAIVSDRDSSKMQGTENDDPLDLPIGSISSEHLGLYIKTKGRVVSLTPSWQETAPNVAQLSSGADSISVVYWKDVADTIPEEKKPEAGKILQITGKLREFRDELQIKLYKAGDIIVLSEMEETIPEDTSEKPAQKRDRTDSLEKGTSANPLVLPISELTGELEEQYVIIKGKVTDIKPSWQPSAPTKLTVSDDKGKVVVVYWADVSDKLSEEKKPAKGQILQVKGKISTYRDELQVKVSEPEDLVIVDKNP